MITVYLLDAMGVFIASAQHDPMRALPKPCTLAAPPETTGTEVAQWQGAWAVLPERPTQPTIPLATRQAAAWERIKAERDRRKVLGVKVGAHWYHSDADSRIQQLGLVIMGSNVPAVQWKTLTLSGQPVFVTMTQALAGGIFQGTAAADAAIFAAAEAHRVAMEASDTPESYSFAGGWPASIESAA
jgi:hypothetical protein